ncbi:hypothetical protein COU75_01340 [Candidatus Peregrinibacteria bacterium CG10_big_fil_rev_8_21_14_0_10_42_8]|nr:MAG: hypothetical protein COU75_01340 [Candidatus Peregrinibacteria bacterium CG10_big_fil_rev_8_21_14_0_10_42_8]
MKTVFTSIYRAISRFQSSNISRGKGVKIAKSAILDTSGGGCIRIGNNTVVLHGAILGSRGGTITIGSHCSINPYCLLFGHGNLTIGNDVRIAAGTTIIPANHVYSDPHKLIRQQGLTTLGITIEDDVWIGAGAKILDGVTIAKGCVIGAGAVVTHSTEPYGVYTGVPAVKIKDRAMQ